MLSQSRIGRTEASKLGISIFDCKGLSISDMRRLIQEEALRKGPGQDRTLESARTQPDPTMSVEADQVIEVRDASRDNRTMELDASEIEILGQAPSKPGAPAVDESVTALLADIDRHSGLPPAQPRPKMVGERSDDSVLFSLGEPESRVGGDASVLASLSELQRIGAERKAEEATEPERPASPDSSVEMSLQELQQIERDRSAAEDEEKQAAARAEQERRAALEQRRLEEQQALEYARLVEAEEQLGRAVDELMESVPPEQAGETKSLVYRMGEIEMLLFSEHFREGKAVWLLPVGLGGRAEELSDKVGDAPMITIIDKTYFICAQRHGMEKAVEAVRKGENLVLSKKPLERPAEAEAQADWPASSPWGQDYITRTLEGEELTSGKIVLPERAMRWLMPAPHEGMDENAARAILRRFRDEPRIVLGGKPFFVFAGNEGFAGAKWCVRTGNLLQIWATQGTEYDMVSSMGGSLPAVRVMEGTETTGPGVPVGNGPARYMLQGDELVAGFGALPERALRWLVPAPDEDMKDRVSESIRKKFSNDTKITLNGRSYYIFEGEEGFANASWCARTGNILYIWPQAVTEYDYLGSMAGADGALRTVKESGWPERFLYHRMDDDERARWSSLFADQVPVLMHPMPDPATEIAEERAMLEEMPAILGCRTVSLGGNSYFALPVQNVMIWKEMVVRYPKTRIASSDGEVLSLWEEAGRSLFASTTFHIFDSKAKGPSLPPHGGHVVPYDDEVLDVEALYEFGKKSRYLYPLPENVGEMGVDTFNNLLSITTREVKKSGHSPLLSLHGRWYFALEYSYAGSRLTTLEDGKLRIYPENHAGTSQQDLLARMRGRLARQEPDDEFTRLPADPGQRKPLLTSFPPGRVRYLFNIDADDPNYTPRDSDIVVKDGDLQSVWRMTDHPIPGMTIAVARQGERIIPIREEEPQGRSASELLAAIPADFGKRDPTVELSAADLIVEPPQGPAKSIPPPVPRRRTSPAPAEPSTPAVQIHTGEYEIIAGEGDGSAAKPRTPKPPPPKRKGDDQPVELGSGEFEIDDEE